MPERIQLSRKRGWRKPAGVVVVARPTKWGNPISWSRYPRTFLDADGEQWPISDATRRRNAVVDFRSVVEFGVGLGSFVGYPSTDEIRAELAGKDLACWCPLDGPCHADVLLRVANGAAS